MTEKFLYCTKICASLEEVRGKAVPQGVWTDPPGQGDGAQAERHKHPDTSIGQSTTALIYK